MQRATKDAQADPLIFIILNAGFLIPRIKYTFCCKRTITMFCRYLIKGFLQEKVKTMDFSETIAACDLKVGRCRQLIE